MPSPFSIETERLRLRPAVADDVDDLVRLHDDPLVAEYMGVRERAWYEWRVEASREEWAARGHGFVVVLDARSGRFLGRTGLKYWPEFGETELGWVLRPEARGSGYATEAARAVLDWGFENLGVPYVTAMIRPDNDASVAVAGRLGMAPRRRDQLDGVPIVVYSIDREGWERRSA
ncbi:MAG TPA: GNAT family N-acetyltransferase [Solirubrobacterales bacterium]|nr:GNAT family N-acetyltransferase [Solirubrobacterales bacterium]